jgi:hypothetical protein
MGSDDTIILTDEERQRILSDEADAEVEEEDEESSEKDD